MAQLEAPVPLKRLGVAGRALTTEETYVVRSPWDGAPIAAVPTVDARETRTAIDAAAEAMATPLPAFERAEILDRGANAIREGREELARLLAREIGKPLKQAVVEDERVRMITFTGSAEVGWKLAERAAKKHVSLELGNSTPLIVCSDADLDAAAEAAAISGNGFAGQSCISVQRVLVDGRVHEQFAQRLVESIGKLKVGDPQ